MKKSIETQRWYWYNHMIILLFDSYDHDYTYHTNWIQCSDYVTIFRLIIWLSVRLWTKWLWVRVQLQSLKLQISRLLRARISLTFRQIWVWIHSETGAWHDKKIQSWLFDLWITVQSWESNRSDVWMFHQSISRY